MRYRFNIKELTVIVILTLFTSLNIGIIVSTLLKPFIKKPQPTYNCFELILSYKNYVIIEKKCENDTCFYLKLESPIDNTSKWIKVKDHVYFYQFVKDTIGN